MESQKTKASLTESNRTVEYTTDLVKRLEIELQRERSDRSSREGSQHGDLDAARTRNWELATRLDAAEHNLQREKSNVLDLAGKLDAYEQKHRKTLQTLEKQLEHSRAESVGLHQGLQVAIDKSNDLEAARRSDAEHHRRSRRVKHSSNLTLNPL